MFWNILSVIFGIMIGIALDTYLRHKRITGPMKTKGAHEITRYLGEVTPVLIPFNGSRRLILDILDRLDQTTNRSKLYDRVAIICGEQANVDAPIRVVNPGLRQSNGFMTVAAYHIDILPGKIDGWDGYIAFHFDTRIEDDDLAAEVALERLAERVPHAVTVDEVMKAITKG